eukprot:1969745-Amphidinium_carterae.2
MEPTAPVPPPCPDDDDADLRPLSVRLPRPTMPSQARSSQESRHEWCRTTRGDPSACAYDDSKRKRSRQESIHRPALLVTNNWKGYISGYVPATEGSVLSDQGSLISSTVPPPPPAPTRSQRNKHARDQQRAQDALFKQRQERLLKAEAELQAALGREKSNAESQSSHPVVTRMTFDWYMAFASSNTPFDPNMFDDPPAEHAERYAGIPVLAP